MILIVDGSGNTNRIANLVSYIRFAFAVLFPNITVKRGMHDLKISQNAFCVDSANLLLGSKSEFYLNLYFDTTLNSKICGK